MSTRLTTPLAKVRGLGSAKEGTRHFWHQRLTAIALVPLTLWVLASLVCLGKSGYAAITAWIAVPFNTALLLVFIFALYYHALLGVQVVIEDYIHSEWQKIASLILVKFIAILTGLVSTISVLKVFLGL